MPRPQKGTLAVWEKVLLCLFDNGIMRLNELSKELKECNKHSISAQIFRMRTENLTQRSNAGWSLTEAGRSKVATILPKLDALNIEAMAGSDHKEVKAPSVFEPWKNGPKALEEHLEAAKATKDPEPKLVSTVTAQATVTTQAPVDWQREYVTLANKLVDALIKQQPNQDPLV